MLILVPVAVFCLAVSIPFAVKVNRSAGINRTLLCVILPLLFGNLAWQSWHDWQAASGNTALQNMIAFWCAAGTCSVGLIACGRRLWWLRTHKHVGW